MFDISGLLLRLKELPRNSAEKSAKTPLLDVPLPVKKSARVAMKTSKVANPVQPSKICRFCRQKLPILEKNESWYMVVVFQTVEKSG